MVTNMLNTKTGKIVFTNNYVYQIEKFVLSLIKQSYYGIVVKLGLQIKFKETSILYPQLITSLSKYIVNT